MVGRAVQLVLAEDGDKLEDVIAVLGTNLVFRSEACAKQRHALNNLIDGMKQSKFQLIDETEA